MYAYIYIQRESERDREREREREKDNGEGPLHEGSFLNCVLRESLGFQHKGEVRDDHLRVFERVFRNPNPKPQTLNHKTQNPNPQNHKSLKHKTYLFGLQLAGPGKTAWARLNRFD